MPFISESESFLSLNVEKCFAFVNFHACFAAFNSAAELGLVKIDEENNLFYNLKYYFKFI